MDLFTWSDSLSVGVMELDIQHKKLVGLLNDLHRAMRAGQANNALKPLLTSLINYTLTHFRTEERYMQQYGYPQYAQHKSQHEQLTAKATDLKQRFESGQTMITLETMNFLKDWLQTHIQGSDKLYGKYFAEKGVAVAV